MKRANSKSLTADKDSKIPSPAEVTKQVGREILESRLDPGIWATAITQCEGRQQEAIALYTRLRIRQLTRLHRMQHSKNRSFESRRIAKCMGDNETRESLAKTIQEMLHNTRRSASGNFVKPKLSLTWLTLLFIGTAGTVASLGRLFSAYIPDTFAHPVIVLSLLSGVAMVWGALVLRFFLPKRWIMLGWNTGLVVVCNVVCLSSLFLGTKVIKRAIAADSVVVPFRQDAVPPPQEANAAKPAAAENRFLVSTRREAPGGKN